ncbi:MAG: hypothetical protein Q9165_000757 [Trypethelium subeluteriae]
MVPHKEETGYSTISYPSGCDYEQLRLWKRCQKHSSTLINIAYAEQAQANGGIETAFATQDEGSESKGKMIPKKRADGGEKPKKGLLDAVVQFAHWLNADKDKPSEECFLNSCKERNSSGKKDKQKGGPSRF